jgi:hypothetical protein
MSCWGTNSLGRLGNREKTNTPVPSPVDVIGTPGVAWASGARSKATIDERGLATGLAVDNNTIVASTAASINDNALLTVK